jgi:hypothetical protein
MRRSVRGKRSINRVNRATVVEKLGLGQDLATDLATDLGASLAETNQRRVPNGFDKTIGDVHG